MPGDRWALMGHEDIIRPVTVSPRSVLFTRKAYTGWRKNRTGYFLPITTHVQLCKAGRFELPGGGTNTCAKSNAGFGFACPQCLRRHCHRKSTPRNSNPSGAAVVPCRHEIINLGECKVWQIVPDCGDPTGPAYADPPVHIFTLHFHVMLYYKRREHRAAVVTGDTHETF